jgi:predicted nucleic acid-binding Zn ribbon protein
LSDGERRSRNSREGQAHKDRPPGKLGDVLRHYLTDKRVLDVSYEHVVPALWGQVAGEWYARHTSVTRVWEGVVDVECDSAARAQQLQLDSTEIIRRLNARLGAQYVRQIRPSTAGGARQKPFTAAHGDRGFVVPAPSEAELEATALSAEEERWIDERGAEIADEYAREAFHRALRTTLKLRQWKIEHGWRVCAQCGELHHQREGCIQGNVNQGGMGEGDVGTV